MKIGVLYKKVADNYQLLFIEKKLLSACRMFNTLANYSDYFFEN